MPTLFFFLFILPFIFPSSSSSSVLPLNQLADLVHLFIDARRSSATGLVQFPPNVTDSISPHWMDLLKQVFAEQSVTQRWEQFCVDFSPYCNFHWPDQLFVHRDQASFAIAAINKLLRFCSRTNPEQQRLNGSICRRWWSKHRDRPGISPEIVDWTTTAGRSSTSRHRSFKRTYVQYYSDWRDLFAEVILNVEEELHIRGLDLQIYGINEELQKKRVIMEEKEEEEMKKEEEEGEGKKKEEEGGMKMTNGQEDEGRGGKKMNMSEEEEDEEDEERVEILARRWMLWEERRRAVLERQLGTRERYSQRQKTKRIWLAEDAGGMMVGDAARFTALLESLEVQGPEGQPEGEGLFLNTEIEQHPEPIIGRLYLFERTNHVGLLLYGTEFHMSNNRGIELYLKDQYHYKTPWISLICELTLGHTLMSPGQVQNVLDILGNGRFVPGSFKFGDVTKTNLGNVDDGISIVYSKWNGKNSNNCQSFAHAFVDAIMDNRAKNPIHWPDAFESAYSLADNEMFEEIFGPKELWCVANEINGGSIKK